jgi:hypothetical protein
VTLPSSGSISLAQAAAEYGLSLPVVLPNSFWGKPGMPASGPITLPGDFYGKSNVIFSPDGGATTDSGLTNASVTLACNFDAVWTYAGGGTGSSVSIGSGGSAASITFSLFNPSGFRSAFWTVTGTALGVTREFTVNLECDTGGIG